MKIPNEVLPSTGHEVSLARIVSEDSQPMVAVSFPLSKSSKDS